MASIARTRARTARATALLLTATAIAIGLGCSALLGSGLDDPQCRVDDDCEREPALRGRVCRGSFCVATGSVATAPVDSPCISSSQCTTDAGAASICREGACVRIVSDECTWVAGDFQDPNAIVLGSILPVRVRQVDGLLVDYPYAMRVRLAQDLAVRQWTAKHAVKIGSIRRPLALVQCDDGYTPERTKAALTHLLDVVGAQGVILMTDDELFDAYDAIAQRKVAVVCSDCLGPEPSGASQGGLVRRILPHLTQQASLAAEVVKVLEARVRIERSLAPADRVRVALLSIDNAASRAYADEVTKKLAINGKPPGQAGGDLQRVDHASPTKGSIDVASDVAEPIAAFRPHIVLVSTGGDFGKFGAAIETTWMKGEARPYYVPNELAMELATFRSWVTADELRQRIVGVAPAVDARHASNIEVFRRQYEARYDGELPDESYSGFDAFHSLAYAVTVAAQLPTLRGADIAQSFERLVAPDAITVDLGELGLDLGPPVLLAGGSVNLVGLWNDLDWQLPAGEIRTDSGVWCLGKTALGDLTIVRDSGLRWLDASQSVIGSLLECK